MGCPQATHYDTCEDDKDQQVDDFEFHGLAFSAQSYPSLKERT